MTAGATSGDGRRPGDPLVAHARRDPEASPVQPVPRDAGHARDAQGASAPHAPGGVLRLPGAGGHHDVGGDRDLRVRLPDAVAVLASGEDPGQRERTCRDRRRRRLPLAAHRRRREGGQEHLLGLALPLDPRPHDPDGLPLPVAQAGRICASPIRCTSSTCCSSSSCSSTSRTRSSRISSTARSPCSTRQGRRRRSGGARGRAVRDPNNPCLFCTPRGVTRQNALAYCARDSYPVSPGHSLIIPFRHCADFFDLTADEMAACMELLVSARKDLDSGDRSPTGTMWGSTSGGPAGRACFTSTCT